MGKNRLLVCIEILQQYLNVANSKAFAFTHAIAGIDDFNGMYYAAEHHIVSCAMANILFDYLHRNFVILLFMPTFSKEYFAALH